MMVRKDDKSNFSYADKDGFQVLEMPYSGGKLSMLVLLPKAGSTESLENALTPQNLSAWKSKLMEQRVDVYFPRFKLETKYFLSENLTHMGMPSAFTNAADFSGIDGRQDLYISAVIHQAYVSVDEKGTEAAAATAVVVGLKGSPVGPAIPVFAADHPFIFLIQDRETGNILFMGKVADPTK
jgi:serpin B